MIADIIKFFFIFNYCWYICFKILHAQQNLFRNTIFSILSLVLAIATHFIDLYLIEIKYVTPLFILWLAVCLISLKPQITFIAISFSFGISYSLYAISSFFIAVATYFLHGTAYALPYFGLSILSGICEIILVFLLFRIKRFQNGMNFLIKTSTLNFATILCIFFLIVLTRARIDKLFKVAILAFTFLLAFLIYWWQAQITKSYRRSLELRELESLRTELQEKNATIVKVMEENERIRHINHRDNGLITALDYAVNDYLVTDFTDETAAKARRDELLIEIERIRAGRVSSVNKDKVKATRYETNISLLNILLNQTSKRATDEHVLFSVHFGTELEDFIPRIISEDDLAHLLSDMLENAFIATRDVKNPMIQLQFYKWNKHFVIEIADNGIPFEVDSILNMGISELTTHADTGGSGIGLMDIWSTKEKYGATYHIDEYETPAPFSKKISLTFDKKNRYSVRTWRKDEILAVSKRADLQVYGQDE